MNSNKNSCGSKKPYWFIFICTEPEPPRDVRCPEVPLDVSLQISWKAPNNSNGVILQYQITIHLNNPRVINASSTDLSKNVEGLSPGIVHVYFKLIYLHGCRFNH